MKIAITGASGHIGVNLVRRLVALNHDVRVLINRVSAPLEGFDIERVKGGVLDEGALAQLCDGVEVVVHVAAKIGVGRHLHEGVWEVNVTGTEKVLSACTAAGVRRLIHFSSVHAYNQFPRDEVLDETRDLVTTNGILYDQSKAESQRMVLRANGDQIETLVVNPSGVIGPFDHGSSLLGSVLKMLFTGTMPMIIKGGFDFVDVRDVVEAVVNGLTGGQPGEAYILGHRYFEIKEVSQAVGELLNIKTPQTPLPIWLAKVGLPFIWLWSKLAGAPPLYNREYLEVIKEGNLKTSSDKARRELGLTNRSLQETVQDTYLWYVKNGTIPPKP